MVIPDQLVNVRRLRVETNMGTTDDGNDDQTVRIEEARRRIDRRLEALHRDRSTAIRFVQLNLVVTSLVATGVALGYRTRDIEIGAFVNWPLVIGALFLGASTLLAIVIISEHSAARRRALSDNLPDLGFDAIDLYEGSFTRLENDLRRSSSRVSLVGVLATWTLPFLLAGILVELFDPALDCSFTGSFLLTWILPGENPCWMYPLFLFGLLLHLGVTVHYLEHNTELSLRERLL